jgi:hypothetical protein
LAPQGRTIWKPDCKSHLHSNAIKQYSERSRIMKKCFPITLALAAFATGATPALARPIHHSAARPMHYSAAQAARQMYLYASPDAVRVAGPLPPTAVTVNGVVVGNDPDPRIRLSLIREYYANK